jgi:hypothetical protein
MSAQLRRITRDDIMDINVYGRERVERRRSILPKKKLRRVEVGPHATFHFECYETMWQQVHEMLYIEKGGAEQIEDELSAYNPLIPQGNELVATVMFEIEDERQRAHVLRQLTHVEDTVFIDVGGERSKATYETDTDRTAADGKTSSVHFLRFTFSPSQIQKFRDENVIVMLGFTHPNYGHIAVLSMPTRLELARDFGLTVVK